MKTLLCLIFALLLLLTGLADTKADQKQRTDRVDKLFAPWDKPDSPGCALAVVQDGKIIYKHGYGIANLEYNVPITPATIFHIASTSKQFTAFAIQLLAQDGKLSLDDDVRKYLPELHDFGKTITIRDLLHHTSGLREQWYLLLLAGWRLQDVITEQDILSLVWRQKELNFEPGAESLYSNTGYTLLGVIVKRISGQSLDTFCQERMFKPLGMNSTHFQEDNQRIVQGRSYSYDAKASGGFANDPLQYATVGPTSLFTTVEDLALWDQNFYDGRVGGKTVLAAMLQPGKLNDGKELAYASGLSLGEYRGLKTVEHAGSDAGYRCTLLRFPGRHFSVILLANLDTFNPVATARRVADIYLQEKLVPLPVVAKPALYTEVKVDPKLYDAYVGDYEQSPSIMLTITKEGDRLIGQPTGQSKLELFPYSETGFFLKGMDVQLTFDKDTAGKINQIVMHQAGHTLAAKRVQRYRLSPEGMAEYQGSYYSQELGVLYVISLHDGKLWVRYPRGDVSLEPQKADEFAANAPLNNVSFTRDADKHITGLLVSPGPVRNLRFSRVTIKSLP